MCVKITWKKQISTAKTRNDYCKMCSGHRQQSRSNHCVKRLSTLDVPVVSQFETTCTCITNGKSCTMKLMLIYNILADNVELELTGLLLKHYGLTTFKDWQLKAIISVHEGRNCIVVQPTGSGKSIYFQIPSLYTRKMTVVLTLTISLMTDQYLKLEQNGIPAVAHKLTKI